MRDSCGNKPVIVKRIAVFVHYLMAGGGHILIMGKRCLAYWGFRGHGFLQQSEEEATSAMVLHDASTHSI